MMQTEIKDVWAGTPDSFDPTELSEEMRQRRWERDEQGRCKPAWWEVPLLNWQAAGVPERLRSASFERFEAPTKEHAKARRQAFEWAQGGEGNLILCGPTGTGKSHLACAALRTVIYGRKTGSFVSMPGLVNELARAYRAGWDEGDIEGDTLMRVIEREVVVLDDLGMHRCCDRSLERLFLIAEGRSAALKPTVVTTNLRWMTQAREVIGDRAFSRLSQDAVVIETKFADWRLRDSEAEA